MPSTKPDSSLSPPQQQQNYNVDRLPLLMDSPTTVKACKNLGVTKEELQYKTLEEIRTLKSTPSNTGEEALANKWKEFEKQRRI